MCVKSIHLKHRQFSLKLSSDMGKVFQWEKKEVQWVKHTVNLFQAFVLYEYPVLWTVQLTIWYSIFNNLLLYIVKIYLLVLHHFNIFRNCNCNRLSVNVSSNDQLTRNAYGIQSFSLLYWEMGWVMIIREDTGKCSLGTDVWRTLPPLIIKYINVAYQLGRYFSQF